MSLYESSLHFKQRVQQAIDNYNGRGGDRRSRDAKELKDLYDKADLISRFLKKKYDIRIDSVSLKNQAQVYHHARIK